MIRSKSTKEATSRLPLTLTAPTSDNAEVLNKVFFKKVPVKVLC